MERIEFETPENVVVSYEPAGLGTRFIAWIIDSLILFALMFAAAIVLTIIAAASHSLSDRAEKFFGDAGKPAKIDETSLIFVGIFILIWGFCSFFYYGLSEFFWSGRTPGKHWLHIRVVKADGFSLDAPSILMRNIFRIIDHIPVVWAVPLLSKRSQRLGDMVAGTIVIADQKPKLSTLRDRLLARKQEDAVFRFENSALKNLRPADVDAVERVLERWYEMAPGSAEMQLGPLVMRICEPLAKRLNVEPPEPARRVVFLQDLLTAELRRQYRSLG